jgi:hypothetical protein
MAASSSEDRSSEILNAYRVDPSDVLADSVGLVVHPSLTQGARTRLSLTKIIQERYVHVTLEHSGEPLDSTLPHPATHDHSREPRVWCETHQHEHVASIPRFTYQCKGCGWGQWYTPDARAHEESTGHETYEVEHRVRSPRTSNDERDADHFLNGWKAAIREVKFRHDAGQIEAFFTEQHRVLDAKGAADGR